MWLILTVQEKKRRLVILAFERKRLTLSVVVRPLGVRQTIEQLLGLLVLSSRSRTRHLMYLDIFTPSRFAT